MDIHHDMWFVDRYAPHVMKVFTCKLDNHHPTNVHINVQPDPPAVCELVGKCLVRHVALENNSFAEMVTLLGGEDWSIEGKTYIYQYTT